MSTEKVPVIKLQLFYLRYPCTSPLACTFTLKRNVLPADSLVKKKFIYFPFFHTNLATRYCQQC